MSALYAKGEFPFEPCHEKLCLLSYQDQLKPVKFVVACVAIIWASSRENLSLGFLTKQVTKQSPQLQRLASELKFRL